MCVNCSEWVSFCVGVGVRGCGSLRGLLYVRDSEKESWCAGVAVSESCNM